MKVVCRHGFFYFEEQSVGAASRFMDDTGLELVQYGGAYTFKGLESVPDFSLKEFEFMGTKATANFEGLPHEIFEANGFVYDFILGKVVSIDAVAGQTNIDAASTRFYAKGMIQAGTINQDGKKIKGYSLWYSFRRATWLYSGVEYV